MKKYIACAVALAAGLLAAAAIAHTGTGAVTCKLVTFSFNSFQSGVTRTVQLKVTSDGQTIYSAPFTFTGATGDTSIAIQWQEGSHVLRGTATWTAEGGGTVDTGNVPVSCETRTITDKVTTTTTLPGTTTTLAATTVRETVRETVPGTPPPPLTVTQTTASPPPPALTVTTPAPPARTVTVKVPSKPKVRTVTIKDLKPDAAPVTVTVKRTVTKQCKCPAGTRLWHGKCHPIAHGKG